jgi:hypothetical protein
MGRLKHGENIWAVIIAGQIFTACLSAIETITLASLTDQASRVADCYGVFRSFTVTGLTNEIV